VKDKLNLRPYQIECAEKIIQSYNQEEPGGIVYMATGLGKTVLANEVISRLNVKTLILVHKNELVNQFIQKLLFFNPEISYGIVKAEKNLLGNKITIASIQTLLGERRLQQVIDHGPYELIITDECFIGSTLIDGKAIKDLKVGDYVNSYNHNTDKIEKKQITSTFKNKSKILLKIITSNGTIYSTPNHPFWNGYYYIKAKKLKKGDFLYEQNILSSLPSGNKSTATYKESKLRNKRTNVQRSRLRLLFNRMPKNNAKTNKISENERNKFKKKGYYFRKNEKTEPNVYRRNKVKIKRIFKKHKTQACNSRWKWKTFTYPSAKAVGKIRRRMDKRICRVKDKTIWGTVPKLLQNRYSKSIFNDSGRSRWREPQLIRKEATGQKKGTITQTVRVESIKILKSPSNREYRRMCPDGYVYNIEVEDNNNYFVNNILVHNCHHYSGNEWASVLSKFNGYKLGLTATPNGLGENDGEVIYRYTIFDGIKNKYLCDIKGIKVNLEIDFSKVKEYKGDFQEKSLCEQMMKPENMEETYKAWEKHCQDRKTAVFCVNVKHAQSLNELFRNKGVKSDVVIGETPLEERDILYNKLESGEIKVLFSVNVMSEGLDLPSLSAILMARPTLSETYYIQAVGRALRLHPNKKNALIIDLVGNSEKFRLIQLGILFGKKPKKDKEAKAKLKDLGLEIPEIPEEIDSVLSLIAKEENISLENTQDGRKFEWVDVDGKFVLTMGNDKLGFLVIEKAGEDFNSWRIKRYYSQSWRDKIETLVDDLPFDWCISIAEKEVERFIEETTIPLISRDSNWRDLEPSYKQIELLNELGCKDIPKTRGDATSLIVKYTVKQKLNGYNAALSDQSSIKAHAAIIKMHKNNELNVKLGDFEPDKLSINEVNRIKFFHFYNQNKVKK